MFPRFDRCPLVFGNVIESMTNVNDPSREFRFKVEGKLRFKRNGLTGLDASVNATLKPLQAAGR